MRVLVIDSAGNEALRFFANDDSILSIKKQIHADAGIAVEYQTLSHNSKLLDDSTVLESLAVGQDEVKLGLSYNLSGAGAGVDVGDFECKFRCMCCYSGLDGKWDRCQLFCVRCECSIM